MQISSFDKLPGLRLELSLRELSGVSLREGQNLQAVVRHAGADGSLGLELNGRMLEARSNLRLMEGMVLLLRVEREAGQLVLRLEAQQQQQLTQDQALRQLLPRQESLKPLLSQLHQLGLRAAGGSPEGQPRASVGSSVESRAPLPQAISQLLSLLPRLAQLSSADGLQQAISNSGLFLENQLLKPVTGVRLEGDVKNLLLRLAHMIRQQLASQASQASPAQSSRSAASQEQLLSLLKQSESSLARIQVNQLNSLASQARPDERLLNIELPLYLQADKEAEVIRMQIRREAPRSAANGPLWSVRLHLEPEGHGEIDALVSLSGGRVATTFWCSEQDTYQMFHRHLGALLERYREQGLEPGQCRAMYGQAPAQDRPADAPSNSLIDLQA
ncbi:MAG: flagellar hook-length control protein FliK [Chromatiales bacterium]|nr:flagellar hook-length control protein FliK [Gammaproteobacteria bacterium]MBW6476302.1 flagellar hook-length control protein FliK [Chromatiales bacterium]